MFREFYFFPLSLNSDLKEISFGDNLKIIEFKGKFADVARCSYDEDGIFKSAGLEPDDETPIQVLGQKISLKNFKDLVSVYKTRQSIFFFSDYNLAPHLLDITHLLIAFIKEDNEYKFDPNVVRCLNNEEDIYYLDRMLRLYQFSGTGIDAGMLWSGKGSVRNRPRSKWFLPRCFLEIDGSDIDGLKKLFNQIKNSKEKSELLIEKYIYASSGEEISNIHRFVDFVTILESVFVNGSSSINYSLKIRGANFFADKYPNKSREDIYNFIGDCYKIRSSIVHGRSLNEAKKKLLEERFLPISADLARVAIIEYLDNSKKFDDKKSLCKLDLGSWDEKFCSPISSKKVVSW